MPFSILKRNDVEKENISPWRILIVDDEEDIHAVTKLVLKRVEFDGRPLEFLSAMSGTEARNIIQQQTDIALAIVDVVMETEHSGLELVKWIREEEKNQLIRLVLRTGQPGQAPEESVIVDYDINDYKQKTELDRTKLFTTLISALRGYRDLLNIEEARSFEVRYSEGLRNVIEATSNLMKRKTLKDFFDGLLMQVISLLHVKEEGMFVSIRGAGTVCNRDCYTVIARCDESRSVEIDQDVKILLDKARKQKASLLVDDTFVAYFPCKNENESLLYLKGVKSVSKLDFKLLEVFASSIGVAFDNLFLNKEIVDTQQELISRLGNAVESRSKESGYHIRRIAEFSYLIAKELGLNEEECEILRQASPMHDVGKIATPDSILLKPGKLNSDEMEVMKQHPNIGYEILNGSKRPILKAAAIISQQHHEKFDGSGYPVGLQGEDIHIYARIVAVADVFDALTSKRCYKEAWPIEKALEYLQEQAGSHLDPNLVNIFIKLQDQVVVIRNRFVD